MLKLKSIGMGEARAFGRIKFNIEAIRMNFSEFLAISKRGVEIDGEEYPIVISAQARVHNGSDLLTEIYVLVYSPSQEKNIPISLLTREALIKLYEETNAMLNVQIAINHKLHTERDIRFNEHLVVCPQCRFSFKTSDSII